MVLLESCKNMFWRSCDQKWISVCRTSPKGWKILPCGAGEKTKQNDTKHDTYTAGSMFLQHFFMISPSTKL